MKIATVMFVCASALASCLFGSAPAEAAPNLAVVCKATTAENKNATNCPAASTVYEFAGPDSLVRDCPRVDCAFTERIYRRFKNVQGLVEICKEDKQPGSAMTSCGTNWTSMVMVPKTQVATLDIEEPPIETGEPLPGEFTATPVSGVEPLDVTLAWNVPGLIGSQPCQASGSWSGAKNAIGSETINDLPAGEHNFTQSCTFSAIQGTSTALLTWKPPYLNDDGSELTDIAGYKILYGPGNTVDKATQVIDVQVPGASAYRIAGLAKGAWVFGVQAYNSKGIHSVTSNIAVHESTGPDVPARVASSTVKVSVSPKPVEPASLRVTPVVKGMVTAPVFGITALGRRSSTIVGFTNVGVPCIEAPKPQFTYRSASFYRVARSNVTWWATAPTDNVAVACAR